MTLQAHTKIVKKLFEMAGYTPAKGAKITHAARVFGARWAQQCGLDDKVWTIVRWYDGGVDAAVEHACDSFGRQVSCWGRGEAAKGILGSLGLGGRWHVWVNGVVRFCA